MICIGNLTEELAHLEQLVEKNYHDNLSDKKLITDALKYENNLRLQKSIG